MSENNREKEKEGTRIGGNEREIILLGLLNIESVYDDDWMSKKEEIKKDIENKAVKLNQAFKDPFYFNEHFEFLSAEDYQYVKNNYIYSAILIFNPNIEKQKGVVVGKEGKEGKEGNERNEGVESNRQGEGKEGKKEEGVGVLVLTCKKMQKTQMKYMLIKMLKREIRVESVVLKKKQGVPVGRTKGRKNEGKDESDSKHVDKTNWENGNGNNKEKKKYNNTEKLTKLEKQGKHSELKYLDNKSEECPGVTKKPPDTKVNNFFNMTAYLYGNSNVLTNTSLMQREYCDDEWADKLRRKKKEKLETERNFTQKGADGLHVKGTASSTKIGGGFINSFTSLFKTK